jgi:uncharacterized protein DUF3365
MKNISDMKKNAIVSLFILAILVLACQNKTERKLNQEENKRYLLEGKQISKNTFKVLGKELKAAIKRGGVQEALSYCNISALPITDSLSLAFDVQIRRTSLKTRNPLNKANADEEAILLLYEAQIKEGKAPEPSLKVLGNNKILYTSPIFIQPLCLNCHGTPGSTMLTKNHKTIRQLYPADAAISYTDGELRGMWSITFVDKDSVTNR